MFINLGTYLAIKYNPIKCNPQILPFERSPFSKDFLKQS